jgi:UDP-glucose 4-epimerase
MRILITGAGGTLGRALIPRLAEAGHELVLFDVRPIDSPHEMVVGDIRRFDDIRHAVNGAEAIVHTAAIHGIHLRDHTPQQFYELNLTGTFNAWEAAAEAGVRAFVFSSTMGVYGETGKPAADDAVVELHEELPMRPGDIYGYTKLAGEEMSQLYVRRHGIPSIALRYGMFVPEPFFHSGIRLLYGGVDSRDVARAVIAALDALIAGSIRWDAFNVESAVPFSERDGPELRRDPLAILDRYYPGGGRLLRERGVPRLAPIVNYYPMRRIEDRLGFRPQHNFEQWIEELRSRTDERAPEQSPWW